MMTVTRILIVTGSALCICTCAIAQDLTPKEQLGKQLFFDTNLSTPPKMSCATCHDPAAGYADPRTGSPTSTGVVHTRCGNRNAPQASYAFGGPQELKQFNEGYAGGTFWDGRANTLADQAKGPFLNPLEMKNPNAKHVVKLVQKASYAGLFQSVYGTAAFKNDKAAFDNIADAISAYEQTAEMNPCTSKLDSFLAGKATLAPMERMGMMLFQGKAGCAMCHFTGQRTGRQCAGGCACGCAYTGVCTCGPGCTCGCVQKGEVACSGGCKCGCAVTGVCTCAPGCTCGCLQSNANACAGGCTCGCAFTGVCKCGPSCPCGCPSAPQACAGGCTCGCRWTSICNCGPNCDCGCPSGGMSDGKLLLTNHGYFNLGTPRNPNNPFYDIATGFNPLGDGFIDYGLGGVLEARGIAGADQEMGKFKVPSLRNCAKTVPYMHNGVFADLKTVVQFYNTRDVPLSGWGPPEVNHANIFRTWNFGNLGLTETEIDALVAFLGTFTDGYTETTTTARKAR